MDLQKFRQIVSEAIDSLPDEFRNALENIEVVVEDAPNKDAIDYFKDREKIKRPKFLLLGLYQGVPLSKRDPQFYSMVLPDKISLYKQAIEKYCGEDEAVLQDQIKRTLLHEIGHYFGLKDDKLRSLGY